VVEVIDVRVVAFVLYQLLRLLRGTQGTQILRPASSAGGQGVIATQFNLILLSWLFKNARRSSSSPSSLCSSRSCVGRSTSWPYRHIGRPFQLQTRLYSQAISEANRAAERLSTKKTGR